MISAFEGCLAPNGLTLTSLTKEALNCAETISIINNYSLKSKESLQYEDIQTPIILTSYTELTKYQVNPEFPRRRRSLT